jgi:glucose-fructose oxidoreductase
MVGYRSRFQPHNIEAIRMARAKELGPTQAIVADHGFTIGDPKQWRLNRKLAGGGSLMDIGIYSLNAARYLTGEEPVEITAVEHTDKSDPRFKEVESNILFQLRFPSGVLANCSSSYAYSGQNRYRLIGTTGWLELEPATSYEGQRMVVSQKGQKKEVEIPQGNQFAAMLDHLSTCVMNNQEPLVPGEEGLKDLKAMMAIYEAARTGKTIKM